MSAEPTRIPQQLSFDVGGEKARPTAASMSISGSGTLRSQLYMDDDVTITIADAAGEVVAEFDGTVTAVDFKKHGAKGDEPEFVERIHKIKLGARRDG